MSTLIVLMAPPGAGKTELAEYLHKIHPNSIIINKTNYMKNNVESAEKLYYDTINRNLQEKDFVILDSQAVLYQDRVDLFKNINKENLRIIGIWVEVSRKEANRRNLQKPFNQQPTDEEMNLLFKYKISPMPGEPFDDIFYIIRDENIGMSINYPYLTGAFEALDRIR